VDAPFGVLVHWIEREDSKMSIDTKRHDLRRSQVDRGHGAKLPRKKQEAVAALIESPSIPAAAKAIGIGETTLKRWLRLHEFQVVYRDARRQIVSQAVARLQDTMGAALDTLQMVMHDLDAPPAARVTSARIILELGVKAVQFEELEQRIRTLERIIGKDNL
jgi:hypothetical protein